MQVDYAVGTTYSLDLLTLTTIPLALTGREFHTDDALSTDKLALLHGIRKLSGRLSIFCNSGHIKVPARQQPLFGYLETCVYEVVAPNPSGAFHPKLWVVRYVGPESTIYRVICSSRNATFDRSWDTFLVLEGTLTNRKRSFKVNTPLCDFIHTLPQLTVRNSLPVDAKNRIRQFSEELRIVAFEDPYGLHLEGFHPLGIKGHTKSPIRGLRDRILVVSPFLSSDQIIDYQEQCEDCIIVSRSDELDGMNQELLDQCSEVYMLNDLVESVPTNDSSDEPNITADDGSLHGLHAKLFVSDDGWNSRLWIGSANATNAAFSRNVEFLVELSGRKSVVGIDAILDGTQESMGLKNILQGYQKGCADPDDAEWRKSFDEKVLSLRTEMSRADLKAIITQQEDDFWLTFELQFEDVDKLKPAGIEWSCWPITCDASSQKPLQLNSLTEQLDFGLFLPDSLTEFFAFRLCVTIDQRSADCCFVLRASMNFSRAKRDEALLRRIVQNENDLLRYLLLSSSGEELPVESEITRETNANHNNFSGGVIIGEGLFETLVSCLAKNPDKLHEFETLMSELQENLDSGGISPRFADLWLVIAETSKLMRGEHASVSH